MKTIYGKGDSTEARVCIESELLSFVGRKSSQIPSASSTAENSQLPGLVAPYTSHSAQHLFQVREKNLENTCANALPQTHPPLVSAATTLLSCLSTFNLAQDAAFLLYNKDLKLCILYTSALLLWQAGDASRQQVQGWRVCLPLPQGQTTHWLSCKPIHWQQWPGDHPVHFKPPRKDKIGCAG